MKNQKNQKKIGNKFHCFLINMDLYPKVEKHLNARKDGKII